MKDDELRARFEVWVQTTSGWKACKQRGKPMHLRQNADGSYNDFRVNDRWFAWQACHAAMQGEDVVRDAARYRLIRKGLSEFHGDVYGMAFAEDGDYPVSGNDLDKHVDAMGERHELS